MSAMRYVALTLELRSALHVGAGRAGMIARARSFVPGHVVSYALAAAVGSTRGGQPEHFASALEEVLAGLRCGPLFVVDPDERRGLLPERERARIEALCFTARNQVALHGDSRSAVDGALYEVEAIAAHTLTRPPRPTRLAGGLWTTVERIDGRPLRDWFGALRLGGELRNGLGRVALVAREGWQPDATCYAGLADADGAGLRLAAAITLPGPALAGASGAPLVPWLGRRHCPERGPGRRFDAATLVRIDGLSENAGRFLPANAEPGLGCWAPV